MCVGNILSGGNIWNILPLNVMKYFELYQVFMLNFYAESI